jgi:hypothetical protein
MWRIYSNPDPHGEHILKNALKNPLYSDVVVDEDWQGKKCSE